MAWKRMKLRQQKVWAECDSTGELMVKEGRVSIRYSADENAKVYQAGLRNLSSVSEDQTLKDFPKGKQVDSKPKTRTSFGSAKNRTAEQQVRAVKAAQDLLDSFPKESIVVFTDGSCRGNPGPAGLGVVLRAPNTEPLKHSRFLGTATNNIAELTAILDAIELVEQSVSETQWPPVKIMTDSQYARGVLTQNWKAKANKQLVMSIKKKLLQHSTISIHWVAGHVGIEDNEQADQLANEALLKGE